MNTLLAIILATLFIPETNEETMHVEPLQRGEAAFVDNGDGTATWQLGSGDGSNLRVEDHTALHGYRVEEFQPTEYVHFESSGVTYTVDSGTWTATGVKDDELTITFRVPSSSTINIVKWTESENRNTSGMGSAGRVSYSTNGNTATVTFKFYALTGYISIKGIHLYKTVAGVYGSTNDLSATTFRLKDTLGVYDLNDLRDWAKHLYDGNRGEDWADYDATNDVHLMGHKLDWDTNGVFTAYATDTQLNDYAYGWNIRRVAMLADDNESETLKITAFKRENNVAYITFEQNITDFDLAKVAVRVSHDIADKWSWSWVSYTINEQTLIIADQTDDASFYQLYYGGELKDSVVVTYYAPVNFVGGLMVGGTNITSLCETTTQGYISATNETFAAATKAVFGGVYLYRGEDGGIYVHTED